MLVRLSIEFFGLPLSTLKMRRPFSSFHYFIFICPSSSIFHYTFKSIHKRPIFHGGYSWCMVSRIKQHVYVHLNIPTRIVRPTCSTLHNFCKHNFTRVGITLLWPNIHTFILLLSLLFHSLGSKWAFFSHFTFLYFFFLLRSFYLKSLAGTGTRSLKLKQ